MIPAAREPYNRSFSESRYREFLTHIGRMAGVEASFRVAESPVFIGRDLKEKLLEAADEILGLLESPAVRAASDRAVPEGLRVPRETERPLFLALDFAIVKDDVWGHFPQLIELQGFPSLFAWQNFLPARFREHFPIPSHYVNHFVSQEEFDRLLRSAIVAGEDPETVVLLEIDPMKQNTAVDFVLTEKLLGIRSVHLGDVLKEGRTLHYWHGDRKIPIRRIYNRVIFDELLQRKDLKPAFSLTDDVDVQWAGHPNWFFRISKALMPYLASRFVPPCYFLSELEEYPPDLARYVLKPLYSFSGVGVIFHVTRAALDAIPAENRKHFILQRKVEYEPVVRAPDGLIKTEVRLMFIWEEGKTRPTLVTNLARLSRGEMIGVKYNQDKTWVGSSVCFFEP